jgi:hypothetical protein
VFLRIPSGQLKPHLLMDVSFWIAVAFTVGSVIWVINGGCTSKAESDSTAFLVWLPYVYPSVGTPASSKAGSALGFVGGIIFNIGSYLMVVEALDRWVWSA